jgi:hypothetical protein
VQWIRRVVRTAHLLDNVGPLNPSPTLEEQEREAAAAMAWLDEQADFFLGKHGVIARYRRQARQFITLSATCLVIGLLILSGGELMGTARIGHFLVTGDLLLRAGKIALAVGASLQAYHVFMAYGDLQRSYTVSAHLFKVATEEAKPAAAARNFRRLRTLIYELGRAALVENVSWVLTRRQRHFHPPLG